MSQSAFVEDDKNSIQLPRGFILTIYTIRMHQRDVSDGVSTCEWLLLGHTQLQGSHKDRAVFICCCHEAWWKLRYQRWAGMSAEGKQDLDDYLMVLTCVVIVLFKTNMFAFRVSVCAVNSSLYRLRITLNGPDMIGLLVIQLLQITKAWSIPCLD